jgi:hypothetical protein
MTIPLTGTGGLFTRYGKILKLLADINTFQGTTLITDSGNLYAQYPDGTADEALIDGLDPALLSSQTSAGAYMGFLQTVAQNTLTTMVSDDRPQNSSTDINSALVYLINQMKADSQSVLAMTVGVSASANSGNTGNGVCVSTSLGPTGAANEDQVPEKITINCTADSSTNSGLAGNESFTALGAYSVNSFSWLYPVGSGGITSLSAINASQNVTQGTLLNNGDFETWTVANVPDGFVIDVGTAGTTVKKSTAQHYTGAASLNIVGNGSELTTVSQTFNLSSGTTGILAPLSLYAVNCWVKMDTTPAAGILRIALVDGTNTVINDQDGNANSFTLALTGLGTSFTALNGAFRTPQILPSTVKLQLKLTTALTSARNLYVDRLGLGLMSTLYAGGPSFAVFSGSTNFYAPDGFLATATNSFGAAATQSTFQWGFDRILGMKNFGLLLPSSGSPTINDSLIS